MVLPLKGIKVLEFVGLAPAPFCGKILSDFGASVTRVDKLHDNPLDTLRNGKSTLAVNLKLREGQNLIHSLSRHYDVVVEPFRPGVMERLNLGPTTLLKDNPKLIYARLTGFGQTGPLASRAGHDINYLAISGVLSFLSGKNRNPVPPINLLADFAGGGLLCALGICLALLERHNSGLGQVVDCSMVDGAAYIASWLFSSQSLPIWGNTAGENVLDGGAFFYDTYETKDGKFMSVGAIETNFFTEFVKKLGIPNLEQFSDNQISKRVVRDMFLTRTQKEWSDIFEQSDACVYPVVEWNEAWNHEHNKYRGVYAKSQVTKAYMPQPAPRLSRTPAQIKDHFGTNQTPFDIALQILNPIGVNAKELQILCDNGIVNLPQTPSSKL